MNSMPEVISGPCQTAQMQLSFKAINYTWKKLQLHHNEVLYTSMYAAQHSHQMGFRLSIFQIKISPLTDFVQNNII